MRNLMIASVFGVLAGAAAADSPEEILTTFEIHPQFDLTLAAMEPVVMDPVDMEFDAQGRAFVLEMSGYPFPDGNGKIVLLTDTDGDGVFDSRTVFAEGFEAADSILPYRDGLLVANPPTLDFVKDTNGDNKADVYETWLDGFELENTQHNFNGLTYGLDNWVYGATGGNAGEVFWPDNPEAKTPLAHSDFRIDFEAKRFESIGRSSGGFGLTMDDWGRVFTTHNTRHIFQIVFPSRYLNDLPFGGRNTLHVISDHEEGGLARVYPIGEQVTRVNHPEQSGFFSGACGITFYGGGAFPDGFNGNVFVCDVVTNVVHRDVLASAGTAFTASRGRAKAEFIASTDRGFRPVNLSVGPDGALYVLDMHRAVIEHPEWIPDEIEKDMDINAGKDQGRILRITAKKSTVQPFTPFDRHDLDLVIDALKHPNQWRRMTAQRLLVEWQAPESIALLRDLARSGTAPAQARVHALWALHGLGKLMVDDVATAFTSAEPGLRENALLLAELVDDQHGATVQRAVDSTSHGDARVRMQAALTMGNLRARGLVDDETANAALLTVAKQDMADVWSRWALLSAGRHDPGHLLQAVLDEESLRTHADSPALANSLAHLVAASDPVQAQATLDRIAADTAIPAALAANMLDGLSEGLPANDGRMPNLHAALESLMQRENADIVSGAWRIANRIGMPASDTQTRLIAEARAAIEDMALETEARLDALQLYAFAPYEDRVDLLFSLLDARQPRSIQNVAMDQLRAGATEDVARRILGIWDTLGPDTRSKAADMLIRTRQFHDILLTELESGRLPIGQMNFDLERRRALLFWSSDDIKERASKLFSDAGVVTRQAAIEKMKPALTMPGDPARGEKVFEENCMKCHQMGDAGFNVGPNLTEIARKSKETLLHDILDPNAAADTQYLSYTIMPKVEGDFATAEIVSGIIVDETDDAITLREAGGGEKRIEKTRIEEMRATGLSFMPEELENNIPVESMADLLAYLQMPR